MYEQGDIVWVEFPYSDNPSLSKKRPAMIISNSRSNAMDRDYIMLQVTSAIRNDLFSFSLSNNHLSRPIPATSEVRCNKLATVRDSLIAGRISSVKKEALREIIEKTIQSIKMEPAT